MTITPSKDDEAVRLVIVADEPALFFASIEAAERYLEARDVKDGAYQAAYGPDGAAFSIGIVAGKPKITPDRSRPGKPNDLVAVVRGYFEAIGTDTSGLTLPELLTRAAAHITR